MRRLHTIVGTVLFLVVSPAPIKAQEDCVPQCRSGYMCHEGKCVSRCNPPCPAEQECSAGGECEARPTATPRVMSEDAPGGGIRGAVMGGFVLEGSVYADPPDEEMDTETGFILRGTFDRLITRAFSGGLYANYIASTVRDSDFTTITLGGTLKVLFEISPTTEFRTGIGFGYQMTEVSDVGDFGEDIKGFDVAPITELAVDLQSGMTAVVSLAAFSQPGGGNSEADVTWAPIVFLCGGLQF